MNDVAIVQAAGGVVWRPGGDVAVVHRPHRADWSLPKGKLDAGEDHADAALREVWEETGFRCRLGPFLGSVAYVDGKGRPKEVRYWSMTVVSGRFEPNAEVDELVWLAVPEARARLSYDTDREVLDRWVADR